MESAARWGRMTSHEMLCHVTDAFRLALGEKQVTPSGGGIHKTIGRLVALHTPLPLPRGFSALPEIEQGVGGTPPTSFAADQEMAIHALDRFAVNLASGRVHPLFGPLSKAEWGRWGYIHTDHHLRQFGQ